VALTLESVKEHRDKNWHSVMPRWRLEAQEPSWQRARAGYVELEDVTGNQGAFLSRREPVWKLKTTVHREHLEDFAPDEQLNLPNVVIPAPGQFAAMDLSVVRCGVQILVHGIGGAGALVFSNGTQRMMHAPRAPGETGWSTSSGSFGTVERWASDKPFFFIEVTGLEPVDLVQFQLRSDGGREIKLDDGSYSFRAAGGAKTRVYQRRFVPPPDVGRVSLDLMVSRGLPFEFFIDPKAVER
jgi:hypothetical protein